MRTVCNKHNGAWVKHKKKFDIYNFFFDYYEMVDDGFIHYDRVNKLDKFFDWICQKLKTK